MTMAGSMREIGRKISRQGKDMRNTPAGIDTGATIWKENLMELDTTTGTTAKSTKESGAADKDTAQAPGVGLRMTAMLESGSKANPMVSECFFGLTEIATKATSRKV
jgi:hypothetical protein